VILVFIELSGIRACYAAKIDICNHDVYASQASIGGNFAEISDLGNSKIARFDEILKPNIAHREDRAELFAINAHCI